MGPTLSRRDLLKLTGSAGAAGLLAACGGSSSVSASSLPAFAQGDVSLTLSWWGDEDRSAAYQAALDAFSQDYPNITVRPVFGSREDWDSAMSIKMADGTVEDVCQVRCSWLYKHPEAFLDLNRFDPFLDLSLWEKNDLRSCQVDQAQLAVPIAMTAPIFFWNMHTFQQAGITQPPSTLGELYDAGEAFQLQLGNDFYPLYMDSSARMMLVIFYLQSIFGREWAEPGTAVLNYKTDELVQGLDLIRDLVDSHVLMPMPLYYGLNGSAHPSQTDLWRTGQLGGVFDWDFQAGRYRDALDSSLRDGFTVGEEIPFGDFHGGFAKAAMGLAVSSSCQTPTEAVLLIDYLLNQEEGAAALGSTCGIPASRFGLNAAQVAGAIDAASLEAHQKVMDFFAFHPDPLLEDESLAGEGGIYQQVFEIMDYDGAAGADVVQILTDGLQAAGYTLSG